MRCPDCNKFVSMDFEDPTLESEDCSADDAGIRVQFDVHLVRNCAECGTEMKTGDLTLEEEVPASDIPGWADLTDADRVGVEFEVDDPEPVEEGGGRYAKSYFGATVSYTVKLGDRVLYEGSVTDKMPASSMDESC